MHSVNYFVNSLLHDQVWWQVYNDATKLHSWVWDKVAEPITNQSMARVMVFKEIKELMESLES